MNRFERILLTCGLSLMAAAAGAHDVVAVGEECPARECHVLSVPGPGHPRFRAFLFFSHEKGVNDADDHDNKMDYVDSNGTVTGGPIIELAGDRSTRWSSSELPERDYNPDGSPRTEHPWWRLRIKAAHPFTVHGYIIDNQGGIASLRVDERPEHQATYDTGYCFGHRVRRSTRSGT